MKLSHFIIFSIKYEMKYNSKQNSILAVLDLIQSNAIYNATLQRSNRRFCCGAYIDLVLY